MTIMDIAPPPSITSRARPGAVYAPLYKQIKALILESLKRVEWKPGAAIPSEHELAARFQVSQGTVRKAIDELAAENLLVRRQGKGTFVATHHEPRSQYRFLRLVSDDGRAPGTHTSRILACRRQRAPADIAELLGLKSGAAAVYVERLLSFPSRFLVLDDIWLPARQFRGLNLERLTAYVGPLYGLFESEFGVAMVRAEERIRAIGADERAAQRLEVEAGTPLLLVERVSYSYGERPMEVRRGYCVTDRHYYHNTLT